MKLSIHFQASMQPLKFENVYDSSHIWLGRWLLNHAGIEIDPF